MKSHVRAARSKIEDEVKSASYFILVSTEFGPKWLPCKSEKDRPACVKRENIHLSNVYPPKIKYRHVCRDKNKMTQEGKGSFRDLVKLKPDEFMTLKEPSKDCTYSETRYMEYMNLWK